jgi:hypothetical protein
MSKAMFGRLKTLKSSKGGLYENVEKWKMVNNVKSLAEVKEIMQKRTSYALSSNRRLKKGKYKILWRNKQYDFELK